MRDVINLYLAKGQIRPSRSQYAAPVLFALKPVGGLRLCVDYRELNKVCEKDLYPIPSLQQLLHKLGGSNWFTTIDLYCSYHQLHVKDPDRTAFVTPFGHYEWLVAPFGLANIPSAMSRFMEEIFGDISELVMYLDDVAAHTTGDFSP